MKCKFIAALSFAAVVCMLGGCTEKAHPITGSVADMGEVSAESSSVANADQPLQSAEHSSAESVAVSSTPTSVGSVSSSRVNIVKPQVSVVMPQVLPPEVQTEEQPPTVPNAPSALVGENSYKALNYSEVKGIWISYLELAGLESGSESSFRSAIGSVYDNCAALGINTVFVHVRSHGDAYYDSELYPRTKYIGGDYDPLSIMIDEAHKRGISFQAWINPLRGCSVSDIERENGYPIYDWAGGETRLVELNNYYYLNPAYDEVIDFIAKGAGEIIANYNVDGLHIDDYFYPTTEEWFDSEAFVSSAYNSLDEFRFANCDKLVSSLYSAVKSANSTAIFGVSPQGNYQNNYVYMYADVEKWCTQSGYLDYIMPQIYFGFKNEAQPFESVVQTWGNLASKGQIPMIAGLAPSRIGCEDGWGGEDGRYEWINDKDILKRQFIKSAEQPAYGGICLYSYNSVFNANIDVKDRVDEEISALASAMN